MKFVLPLFLALLAVVACNSLPQSNALSIKESNQKSGNITLAQADVDVVVTGNLAETTLVLTFENSSNRILEATLDLPLPEGASISRYALEIEGSMREGVVVDKQLGRMAYEDTIRQNIDPGLLEKTSGNRFRTRIYPVPAKGSKKVLLSYIEPLKKNGTSSYKYSLPLAKNKRWEQFNLNITSNHSGVSISPASKQKDYQYKNGNISLAASQYRCSNTEFSIISNNSKPEVLVQKGNDGAHYFYVSASHQQQPSSPRFTPRKILLVWDASHSTFGLDRSKELRVLESYLHQYAKVNVDLRIIRNQVHHAGSYTYQHDGWKSLIQRIRSTQGDGATNLSQLDLRANGYDAVLCFTDGIGTVGESTPRYGSTPIYTISSSQGANHSLLQHLAKKTKGASINLNTLTHQQAFQTLTQAEYKLLKVTGAGISEVAFDTHQTISNISGKLSRTSSTATLHYGINGKVMLTKKMNINRSTHKRGGTMAAKLWAQKKIDALSINKKRNRAIIVRLATTHKIVTDFTSLIVLDRIEDYVRYRIVPPTATLRKQYYAQLKHTEKDNKLSPADLNEVYANWKDIVKWHHTSFPRPKKTSKPAFIAGGSIGGQRNATDFISPASPAPMVEAPNIITAGNRSGDFAITRDSIDAFLNNPNRRNSGSISIKGWKADTPYEKALQQAVKSNKPLLPVYYRWKKKYQHSPGFYLDASNIFFEHKQKQTAMRILSNLTEISSESVEMNRILAHRYSQMGEYKLAESLFRKILVLRGEEPQSYRDLALVLIKRKRYTEAEKLLWKVISTEWDWRFNGIELIVLNEWNHLHDQHGKHLKVRASQKRFRHSIDADIRIVISWDTDNSDMDLWVTNPDGEKCYYSNDLTEEGGRISEDMTDGRGPEEFMITKAKQGKYKIEVDYFGTREQTSIIGPTTLHCKIITNWNRKNQKEKHLTFQLGKEEKEIYIGDVIFEK